MPEIVELGYFIGITLGQQRWIKTLDLQHFDIEGDSKAGMRSEA